jgi:hypothetical protein
LRKGPVGRRLDRLEPDDHLDIAVALLDLALQVGANPIDLLHRVCFVEAEREVRAQVRARPRDPRVLIVG